jgi:hypothetical protein
MLSRTNIEHDFVNVKVVRERRRYPLFAITPGSAFTSVRNASPRISKLRY